MKENKSLRYCSPREMAESTGKRYMQIMRKIRNGEIKAEKVGWNWVIPVSEFEDKTHETN